MRNSFIPIAIIVFGATAILTGCSCNKEDVPRKEQEKINKAQEQIVDIISSCVSDSFDADEQVEDHLDEIRSNPAVKDAVANDAGVSVTYTDGTVEHFVYDYGSVFDDQLGNTKSDSFVRPSIVNTDQGTGYFADKYVHVFNLFSEDEGREKQNELVKSTIMILQRWYGNNKVIIHNFKDFTSENLAKALNNPNCMAVYIYSFGNGRDIAIGGGYYTGGGYNITSIDGNYISKFYSKMTPVGNIVSSMLDHSYNGFDICSLIANTANDRLAGKLLYLSSCNTLAQDFNAPGMSAPYACITGWNGVNKLGEAYGLIMTDYMLNRRRDLSTFISALSNKNGKIEDVYANDGACFTVKGSVKNYNFWKTVGYSYNEGVETLSGAKVFFTSPANGTCINTCYLYELGMDNSLKLGYKYRLNQGESIGLFESTHPLERVYFIRGEDFNYTAGTDFDYYYYSQPLDCKWSKSITWTIRRPGAFRFEIYSQSKEDWDNISTRGEANITMLDAIYVINPVRFKQNDANEIIEPVIKTIGALKANDKVYAYGGVIDMDGTGFKKGFKLWQKGAQDRTREVISDNDALLFYSSLPGLKAGQDYVIKAFLVGPNAKYYYGEEVEFTSEIDTEDDSNYYTMPEGAVDLGLSVFWATCNIGSNAPEDYGEYYAWGETQTKDSYTWETYKWGGFGYLTKYNNDSSWGTVDSKVVLDYTDDVAHTKLGDKWRMPTDDEWTELRDNCTWTWETNYNGTGINGELVTATNGNSIFLPAAGYRGDTDYHNFLGTRGYYWSSSLYGDPEGAFIVCFSSYWPSRSDHGRCGGLPVRPVYDVSSSPIPEAVDLGLPSGLKWASFNVGATKPEEYGDYFAWGETATKNDFRMYTYKWWSGTDRTFSKYCTIDKYWYSDSTPDNKVVLDDEDDAASVLIGGNWRMPTRDDYKELLSCSCVWTEINGINGLMVEGNNGNHIFLPAGGYRNSDHTFSEGDVGYYWSSCLDSDYPLFAEGLFFGYNNNGSFTTNERTIGQLIRAVL